MLHKSVLLHESIDGLNITEGDIFLDCTFGAGGHSLEVAKNFKNDVEIVALDLDQDALEKGRISLEKKTTNFILRQENFRNLDKVLDDLGISKVNNILFDFGLSSDQFETSGRGFSFQKDEPLLMTMKKTKDENDLTAYDIVNFWEEENIFLILKNYGEEKFAYKIAKKIVEQRKIKPIKTTFDLVEIVGAATPTFYHSRKIHPATKTFQALRIAVNDELGAIKEGIEKGFERLSTGGRIAAISFHSLEDRIVKNFFKEQFQNEKAVRITKKPIIPSIEEVKENPRARSAKLRIIEKNK